MTMRTHVICAATILAILASTPAHADAQEPFLWVRGELGAGLGLNGVPNDAGAGGHLGAEAMVYVIHPLAIAVRAAGTYFSPFQAKPDALHASWSGGLILRLDGLWLGGFAGMHESLGENVFGIDALLGYDFALGANAGIGPFVSYSVAALDKTLYFVSLGVTMSVGVPWASAAPDDPDHDGIVGTADVCPNDPEDMDGNADQDGCPEADDRDGDGLLDNVDRCPAEAEDMDEYQDSDGCPDPDNDGDHVLDGVDGAPNDAEDPDGFEDADGVPDLDNDHDFVPDASDGAPNDPEDRDGFQDEDGVPDPDNDQDGILDGADQCPTAPGPATTNGCPVWVRVEAGRINILQRIEFATDHATLLPSAGRILEEIRAVLAVNPQIRHVRIEGHTDDRGRAPHNLELSQARAQTVMTWLTDHRIAAERLEAQGFGQTRPLLPNTTNPNRQTNRRVEFIITDPAPPATEAVPATPSPTLN